MFEFAEWLQATPFSVAIQSTLWLTPLLQTIHITMIGIVFVSMLNVALRVLGQIRADEPLADVWRRFAPWFWSALGVMAGTGLVLVDRRARAPSHGAVVLAQDVAARDRHRERAVRSAAPSRAAARAADPVSSGGARFVAVATILLWVAIIFLGRWIAYDVEIWESWHLA